jgi:hypothetical protein
MSKVGHLELAERIAAQTLHLPNRKAWREIASLLGGRQLTAQKWQTLRREAWAARKRHRRAAEADPSNFAGEA